jgi:hypothetical protein
MNKHLPLLLSLLLFPAAALVRAETPLRIEADLADGSRLLGTPGITSYQSGQGVQARVQGAEWTPEGRLGGGYRFGGVRQMLVTEAVPELGGCYSLAMWAKFDHFDNAYPMLLADARALVMLHGLGPAYSAERRNRVGYYSGAAVRERSYEMRTDLLTPGRWALVVVVVDQTQSTIYLDGKLSSTTQQQTPRPLGALDSLSIGFYNIPEAGESQQFNGVLDEGMIWKRALSAQEVQELAGDQDGRGNPKSE